MNYSHGQSNYPVFAYARNYDNGYIEDFHQHDRIQLLHTLTGVIHVKTVDGIWVIPPTRGIWIPENIAHSISIHGQVKARGIFVEPFARADFMSQCSVVAIPNLLSELINEAVNITDHIIPQTRNERLLELILDELRFLEELPFQLPESKSLLLKRIMDYLKSDFTSEMDLEKIASKFHMSSKKISRLFLKETNMNFSTWYKQAKLLKALTELEMGKPILNIALELGYESSSAFSYMFKREMGVSPTDYLRKKNKPLA